MPLPPSAPSGLPASALSTTASYTTTQTIGAEPLFWNAMPSVPSSYAVGVGTALIFRYNVHHNVWLLPTAKALPRRKP